MQAFVSFSNYDIDKDIATYSVFIPTSAGMKVEVIDIHYASWNDDNDIQDQEEIDERQEIIKRIISKKYKTKISLNYIKSNYHVYYR